MRRYAGATAKKGVFSVISCVAKVSRGVHLWNSNAAAERYYVGWWMVLTGAIALIWALLR
jgi:hypothetical protein